MMGGDRDPLECPDAHRFSPVRDPRGPGLHYAVTGGRTFINRRLIYQTFVKLEAEGRRITLAHGAAPGADSHAKFVAENNFGWKTRAFPADWDRECDNDCMHGPRRRRRDGSTFCPTAGPIRNQRIIDEIAPDLLIAFPGNLGTSDMVRRAKRAGILTFRVEG